MQETLRNPEYHPSDRQEDRSAEAKEIDPDELLHTYVDRERLDPTTLSREQIHDIEQSFRHSEEIHHYLEQEVNIEHVQESVDYVRQQATSKGLTPKAIDRLESQSQERISDIEHACHNYAESVRRFERSKIARFREGFDDQLENWDQARRQSHNAMVDSLRAYNRFMSVKLPRESSIEVPRTLLIPENFFNEEERMTSGDWAITTDYYLRAKSLIDSVKKEGRH